jgi:hypothetical protein
MLIATVTAFINGQKCSRAKFVQTFLPLSHHGLEGQKIKQSDLEKYAGHRTEPTMNV